MMGKSSSMSLNGFNQPPGGSTGRACSDVIRSRSFSSMTNYQRTSSGTTSPMGTPVLGEMFRNPSGSQRSLNGVNGANFKKLPKIPNVPRPHRVAVIFDSIKMGLRECAAATEEDIETLRRANDTAPNSSTLQAKTFEREKQRKAAERYKRRLEYHLEKIEELEENYALQQQLREGARNMAKAYTALQCSSKETLSNVRCGYKECTKTMCAIEAQLENMLGTFHCRMKGLVGFARLMRGDTFEVSLRYGQQKWKSKGRVGEVTQEWQNDSVTLRALVGDVFNIKAVEVRGLTKSVLLGQKNCETKDLFSSNPQMMSVSMNTNGSIKLSVIITWDPLEGVDENFLLFEPRPLSQAISKRRLPLSPTLDKSSPCLNGRGSYSDHSSSCSSSTDNSSSRHSMPVFSSTFSPRPPNSPSTSSPHTRPTSIAVMEPISESASDSRSGGHVVQPNLFNMHLLTETLQEGATWSRVANTASLEDVLDSLRTVLEDYRGHHPELRKLEEKVEELDRFLKRNTGPESDASSEVSISIETALGAFDFLESEDYLIDGSTEETSRHSSTDRLDSHTDRLDSHTDRLDSHTDRLDSHANDIDSFAFSPKSTTKTRDSGIESLTHQLSDERTTDLGLGAQCSSLTTSNDQVDQALLWHLAYCERLLEHLGHFGPLKCKEIYALAKLRRQADIIERLMDIARAGSEVTNLQQLMLQLTDQKDLRKFWVRCINCTVLCANAERLIAHLERCYGDRIREQYDIAANRVFCVFVARLLDIPQFNPNASSSTYVTMHQMMGFFEEKAGDLPEYLLTLAGELWVCGRLTSGYRDIIIKTVLTFGVTLPPAECVRRVALLMLIDDAEVRHTATNYFKQISEHPEVRNKALLVFLEALEDGSVKMRCAACLGLQILKAQETMEQVVFLSESDRSAMVKQAAKDTLFSFGDEGRLAYQESQLTAHGFQGVDVRL